MAEWRINDATLPAIFEGEPVPTGADLRRALLDVDLREFGEPALCDLLNKDKHILKGPILVQLSKLRNVTLPSIREGNETPSSAVYRLNLTDGHAQLMALILPPANVPGIDVNTPPGTKLVLSGEMSLESGFVLLTKSNCQVLGGHVDVLVQRWRIEQNSIAFGGAGGGSKKADVAAPKWISFGKKDAKKGKTDPTLSDNFKANDVIHSVTTHGVVDENFDSERKANIKAVKDEPAKKFEAPKTVQLAAKPETSREDRLEMLKKKAADREKKAEARGGERRKGRRGRGDDDEDSDCGEYNRPAQPTTLFDFISGGVAEDEPQPVHNSAPGNDRFDRQERGGGRGDRGERGERGGRGGRGGGSGRGGRGGHDRNEGRGGERAAGRTGDLRRGGDERQGAGHHGGQGQPRPHTDRGYQRGDGYSDRQPAPYQRGQGYDRMQPGGQQQGGFGGGQGRSHTDRSYQNQHGNGYQNQHGFGGGQFVRGGQTQGYGQDAGRPYQRGQGYDGGFQNQHQGGFQNQHQGGGFQNQHQGGFQNQHQGGGFQNQHQGGFQRSQQQGEGGGFPQDHQQNRGFQRDHQQGGRFQRDQQQGGGFQRDEQGGGAQRDHGGRAPGQPNQGGARGQKNKQVVVNDPPPGFGGKAEKRGQKETRAQGKGKGGEKGQNGQQEGKGKKTEGGGEKKESRAQKQSQRYSEQDVLNGRFDLSLSESGHIATRGGRPEGSGGWKVGMRCEAPWQDGQFYPARIVHLGPGDMCAVEFDGYGDVCTLPLGVILT